MSLLPVAGGPGLPHVRLSKLRGNHGSRRARIVPWVHRRDGGFHHQQPPLGVLRLRLGFGVHLRHHLQREVLLRHLASPFQHAAEDQDHGGRHPRRGCADRGREVRRHREIPRHLFVRRDIRTGEASTDRQPVLFSQQTAGGCA